MPRRSTAPRRWTTRRALVLHVEVCLFVPMCLLAGWWQATRALAGNALSWAYTAEWPGFAILAIAAWWHLIHEDPDAYAARKRGRLDWDEQDAYEVGDEFDLDEDASGQRWTT